MPVLRHPVSLCVALFAGAAPLAAADVLETVAAARNLPFSSAAAGQEAKLSGVVTYLRDIPQDFNFYLHDATGGVMVYPVDRTPLQPGRRVTVTGVTAMSVHGLRVTGASVDPGETGTLPEPLKTTMSDVLAGKHEGLFAEMEGVIRVVRLESPEIQPQRLALDFGSRNRRLTVWITRYAGAESRFSPGAKVRARGVVVRWKNPRGQTQSTSVLVNSVDDIVDVAPPGVPLQQSLSDLQLWSGPDEPAGRVAMSGVVTYCRPGDLLVVQDGERAIRVRPAGAEKAAVGDTVEVKGFPVLGEYTVELEDASVDNTGCGITLPPGVFRDAASVLAGPGLVDRDARLVRVTAMLRELRERADSQALEMNSGGITFTAFLPSGAALPDGLAAGAELRLTGICSLHLSDERRRLGRPPGQFSLLVSGPGQVEISRPAPWWNRSRLLAAVAIIGLAALLAALWATLAGRKNALLRAEISRRERAEQQLANDRRRVAGDLHDTLEQTLLAAGLQLNAAGRTLTAQPEAAAARVTLASQLVARGRQEVRDAVWDLHAGAVRSHSLAGLLATACTEAAASSTAEVFLFTEGNEPPLPALIVAQSVRFVREAVTNALKHGSPQHVRVTMNAAPEFLTLTVADDGCGFQIANAPGPDTGHFGLGSMRERVQRLGGSLDITSMPGTGTTITARIPIPS